MALNEVLVIDDNTDILKLLNALLQQHNFKVRLENNGAIAIKSIQARLPDLILLDLPMPEMNGIEICKHIKSKQKTNHISIIFLSAQKNDKQIAEGLLAEGVDFISKPFSVETLLLRVGVHIKINQLQKDLSCFNLQLQNRVENRTRILHETNKQLKQLKHAIKASYSGIWDWDLTTNKFYYNDAFFSMLGYQPIDFLQDSFSFTALIHSEDISLYKEQITRCLNSHDSEFQIEYRLRKQDTTYCWVLSKGMVVEKNITGHPLRMTGTHTDISAEKQKQQSLRLLSQTDHLTGLANRAFFITQVKQVLINTPGIHALFFIDLDGFKQINDTFGHHAGDTVLTTIAERLCCLFRQKDILCRFGGDEFAIFLPHSGKNHFAPESATRLLKALNTPIKLDGESINISSSIGISFYPHDGTTAQLLLKNADIAMYQAKAMGKNTYQLFSPNIAKTITKQKSLRGALKSAVKNYELILYFQPQIDRSFIKGMTSSNVGQQIVETIINLSHALDIKITAERRETEEQANLLSSMG